LTRRQPGKRELDRQGDPEDPRPAGWSAGKTEYRDMLKKLLSTRKAAILERWRGAIFAGYFPDTSKFLQKEKDRFSNPVGHAVHHGTEMIFDSLLEEKSHGDLLPAIDEMVRIRAVQDFTPSEAVGFVFLLKKAVRAELEKDIRTHRLEEEVAKLESKIDGVALLGFDLYMACRQKIQDLRLKQVREQGLFRPRRSKEQPE
jgi:hypothetical protein